MTISFTGIVIAGGVSRRFGSPKAFAKRNGKPFYSYSISVLEKFCSKVMVVTNEALEKVFIQEKLSVKVITDFDEVKGQGPLAGLYSAMLLEKTEWFIVLPVDVPFITEKVIDHLINQLDDNFDAIVPVVNDKTQPLISIYRSSIKDKIKENLSQGKRSFKPLFEQARVKYVTNFEDDEPFININRQEDFPN